MLDPFILFVAGIIRMLEFHSHGRTVTDFYNPKNTHNNPNAIIIFLGFVDSNCSRHCKNCTFFYSNLVLSNKIMIYDT